VDRINLLAPLEFAEAEAIYEHLGLKDPRPRHGLFWYRSPLNSHRVGLPDKSLIPSASIIWHLEGGGFTAEEFYAARKAVRESGG
jgi:hypothetical protein